MTHGLFSKIRAATLGTLLLGVPEASARAQGAFKPIMDFLGKVESVSVFGGPSFLVGSEGVETARIRAFGLEVGLELQEADPTKGRWSITLAASFEYAAGFDSEDATIDLRGAVRGLPTIMVYASPPEGFGTWAPYGGIGAGVAELWQVRAFDAAAQRFDATASTFQPSLSFGFVEIRSGFFVEGALRVRRFESIDWKQGEDGVAAPVASLRTIDLSSISIRVGFQFWKRGDEKTSAQ